MTYLEDEKIAEKRRAGDLLVNAASERLRQHFAQHPLRIMDAALAASPVPYDEVWIVLYGMGQRVSLETGAMFKVDSKPVARFELVHYDRYAGFTVSPEDWAAIGSDGAAQMAFLRLKVQEARDRLYEAAE